MQPRPSRWFSFTFIVCALQLIASPGSAADSSKPRELVVYTYDSLVAEGGFGPKVFPLFEKKCGCRLKVLPSGDGAQLLTRLQLDSERKKDVAHVVLGIDGPLWEQAKAFLEEWGSWTPAGYDQLEPSARLEKGFLPFDYGLFAFMADREALKEKKLEAPVRLADLEKEGFRRNVILEDPRTSTPGLSFVLYTHRVLGEAAFSSFWKKMKSQWLTLAPGWDAAYGLFLKKEAPLVWSYVTSQAYHVEHGDRDGRYRALIFEDGQPIQVEGAALVKGVARDAEMLKLARSFLEFLISPEAQKEIPKTNWMYPARRGVDLPESFKKLPKPRKIVALPNHAPEVKGILKKFEGTL